MSVESFQFGRPRANPNLYTTPPMRPFPGWERLELTASCKDARPIPKVDGAGGVFAEPDGTVYQRMHNGVKVLVGAYHGEWTSELIRRLGGHHEPQEEAVFHAVLPFIKLQDRPPVMIELGSFWAYYSLWFRSVYPHARSILVEPDPGNLTVGERNFALNGFSAETVHAGVGTHNGSVEFLCESDNVTRPVRTVSVDGLMQEMNIGHLDLLHADIQGAELAMLGGAAESIAQGRISWLFASTHHYSISQDPLIHQRCLEWLRAHGAHIIAEHSVSESFSGDGLIVAAFGPRVPSISVPMSRNTAPRGLFLETEYDLDDAWNEIRRLQLKVPSEDEDTPSLEVLNTQQERDTLAARVTALEQEGKARSNEIARLTEEKAELNQALLKSRLWIGQLSQELAARKRRTG